MRNKWNRSPLGVLIKKALVARGWTSRDLAQALGMCESHISWNMVRKPKWDYVRRVSEVLSVPKEVALAAWDKIETSVSP